MIKVLTNSFALIVANWEQALISCIMIVSTVISLMGLAKNFIKKIPNDKLRRFVLAFGSLVLVLPITAGVFAIQQINYNHYWIAVALNAILTIVGYWLYEYTCCRDLMLLISKNTIGKIMQLIISFIVKNHNKKEVQELISLSTQSINQENKANAKIDYTDLNNL